MSVNQVSGYVARAIFFSVDGVQIEGVTNIDIPITGVSAEIDFSDLSSEARQFEGGIPDPGTSSCELIIDPSTPGFAKLKESADDSLIYELRVVVGAKGANSAYTDGSPIQTSLFPAVTSPSAGPPAGVTSAANKITIAKAQAGKLKGTKPGHYILSGSAFGTSNEITSVTTLTNGDVELGHGSNTAITLGNNSVKIVKPAWEARWLAYVQTFRATGAIDEPFKSPLEFRNSGLCTLNGGNPGITL